MATARREGLCVESLDLKKEVVEVHVCANRIQQFTTAHCLSTAA